MKKLQYTDDLWDILVDINDDISNAMMDAEDLTVPKGFAEWVDKSDSNFSFDVKIDGKNTKIKVGTYIRTSFPNQFSNSQIMSFIKKYNELKNGGEVGDYQPQYTRVEVPEFKFNPKDVRSTFISLVTETYPYGHEEEVVPKISQIGLQKDEFGNYYKIVGKSETMFTSHLDTADRQKSKVNLVSEKRGDDEILRSDGSTILGADDKSGVAVMLYMIAHNVPGIYYFFIGEERGGIGSGKLSKVLEKTDYVKDVKRCISFDRRNYYSIVTSQYGVVCCSDEFGNALGKELSKGGLKMNLDPTGVFTDSASFMEQIPECTNVSVGYFEEHTRNEHQNITFLEKLAKACVNVDWENLPTVRKIGLDEDVLEKYGTFLEDLKGSSIMCSYAVTSQRGDSYLRFVIDEIDFDVVKEDITTLSELFNDNQINPDIYFDEEALMVELTDDEIRYNKYFRYMESFSSFNEAYEDFDDSGYMDDEDFLSDDEEVPNGGIEELCFWLRKMYKANNLEAEVESEDESMISAYIFLDKRERISTLLSVFDVTDKIKRDLLTYHSVEVELYENEEGYPIFKFDFKVDDYDGEVEY